MIGAMKQRLKQALARHQKRRVTDASRVPAAVLVPIYEHQGEHYVVFIKRSELVKNHKGEITFPGGVFETEDQTLLNTALRESEEEIALAVDQVEVLGELDDAITLTSHYTVTPFVGAIPWPYRFQVDEVETEAVIPIPVSALLADGCCTYESVAIDGKQVTSYFYRYQGKVIWGGTARILNQFLEIFCRVVNG